MERRKGKDLSNVPATAALTLAVLPVVADVSGLVMWLIIGSTPMAYGIVIMASLPIIPLAILLCGVGGLITSRTVEGRGKRHAFFALGILALYIIGFLVWGLVLSLSPESAR